VLLRFYLRDDSVQSPRAKHVVSSLSEGEPGWVALTTVLELVWVVKSKKQAGRDEIARLLESLLAQSVVVVEQSSMIARAVQRFRTTRADFADCLVAESARAAGCNRTLTFDEIAARDLGMELIA
jgi:predicted nucleic-acid-binding protein